MRPIVFYWFLYFSCKIAFAVTEIERNVELANAMEVPGFIEAWKEVEEALKNSSIPGLVMSVVQGHERDGVIHYKVFSKAYGYARVEEPPVPVNFEETRFAIGSLSKAFASTLIGSLLSEQEWKYPNGWDTTVVDIMKDNFSLPLPIVCNATLRDLLSHRTGVRGYAALLVMGIDHGNAREYCRRMKLLEMDKEFRHAFEYSNSMFVLLGCIVETMGNDTYFNLIRKRVLDPLGMTSYLIGQHQIDDSAIVPRMYYKDHENSNLFLLDNSLISSVDFMPAAGGVLATGLDMARWIIFHLDEGKKRSGERLLHLNLWKEMHETQIQISPSNALKIYENNAVGLGWFVGTYRNVVISEHGGRIGGFDSKITLVPTKKFGIFTSANGPAYNSHSVQVAIHLMMYDVFNNETIWLDRHTLASYPNMNSTNRSLPPKNQQNYTPLEEHPYTGTYGHKLFGNFTIYNEAYEGPKSLLKYRFGLNGRGKLVFLSEYVCVLDFEGPLAHILRTTGGEDYSFKIRFADRHERLFRELIFTDARRKGTTFQRELEWEPFHLISSCSSDRTSFVTASWTALVAGVTMAREIGAS